MNMSESEIQSLITSLMNTQANTYEGNMKNLLKSQNYVTLMPDLNIPESMAIIMNKL